MTEPLTPEEIVPFLLSVIASGERLTSEEVAHIRSLDAARSTSEGLREAALEVLETWPGVEDPDAEYAVMAVRAIERLRAALGSEDEG